MLEKEHQLYSGTSFLIQTNVKFTHTWLVADAPFQEKHNDNERAAKMEALLEDGINAIGLGPQGMGGKYSVMGVNIENTARHPSAIGVAVNVGCWSHRRGHIVFDKDLNYKITTHTGVEL